MSALRVHHPGEPVRLVDLGPCRHVPLVGRATLSGHLVRPAATKHATDATAVERVRAFRERHGGRKAVAA